MERFTEKITNKETGQVLAYRVPGGKTIQAAKKLGELEDLEEKGLLLVLPCKPGEPVYRIITQRDNFDDREHKIVSACNFHLSMISEIGKTVFLTEEEANIRLRELGLNEKK